MREREDDDRHNAEPDRSQDMTDEADHDDSKSKAIVREGEIVENPHQEGLAEGADEEEQHFDAG